MLHKWMFSPLLYPGIDTDFRCNLIGSARVVKPRIGRELKGVDAQIAASWESLVESWVGGWDGSSGLQQSFEAPAWSHSSPSSRSNDTSPQKMAEAGWQLTHHCWWVFQIQSLEMGCFTSQYWVVCFINQAIHARSFHRNQTTVWLQFFFM